ncbi:unnamed protein product [Laminaria digitata]
MSGWKASSEGKGLTTSLVLRLPTTPHTHRATSTQSWCLRQLLLWSFHHQATAAVGGYNTRGRMPLFEEQIRGRDRRHGGCSASVSSAMLWQGEGEHLVYY